MSNVRPFDPEAAKARASESGLPTPKFIQGAAAQDVAEDLREVIPLKAGKRADVADAVERVLATTGEVYLRGDRLVRLVEPHDLPKTLQTTNRAEHQLVVTPVTATWICYRAAQLVRFERYAKREKMQIPTDLPRAVAEMVETSTARASLSPLIAIATAPFLRDDLTVCDRPGYDSASGIYLAEGDFAPLLEHPTQADAQAALKLILEPFDEMPFATPASQAAFLAHVLTDCVRPILPTTPAFFYTAPVAATGKTLLAQMPQLIASGEQPAMRTWPGETEELRKVLFGSLLAGDRSLLFDNLLAGTKIRSASLCAVITADRYGDRRLGSSSSESVPNRCTIVATGNNIVPCGDLARRSLVIRLDADAESARGRTFRIANLKAYVLARRRTLIAAALTIVRAYVGAGAPSTGPPLESFERWTTLVCDPLRWLGMSDPIESQDLETDDEIAALGLAFQMLAKTMYGEFRARDVVSRILEGKDDESDSDASQLRDALQGAGCHVHESAKASKSDTVGYWLRAQRDKIAGGYKLVRFGKGHVALWRLKSYAPQTRTSESRESG